MDPARSPAGPVDADHPGRVDLPGDLPALRDHADAFDELDDDLPLALLPVRLETRFAAADGVTPPRLKIRILPDVLHTDGLRRELSAAEQEAGRDYWRRSWDEAGRDEERARVFTELASQLGGWRAAWVVRQTEPTNLGRRPGASANPAKEPRFADDPLADRQPPALARLLPARWVLLGYVRGVEVLRAWTRPVADDLCLSPEFPAEGEEPPTPDDGELPLGEGMRWLVDYDRAVDAGMAVTVDLDGPLGSVADGGLDELLALGVGGEDALAELLEAQRYTRGVELIAPGTPTNQTDTVETGWSPRPADPGALLDREEPGRQPALDDDEADAARLADALGLPRAGRDLLARTADAAIPREAWARDMNRVLWHATLGPLLGPLLRGSDDERWIGDDTRAWVRAWFCDRVRAAGPLPALRVGAQPYGVLPVMERAPFVSTYGPGDDVEAYRRQQLGQRVESLRTTLWEPALGQVPVADPDATDHLGEPLAGDEAVDDAVVRILATTADPSRFWVRPMEVRKGSVQFAFGLYALAAGVDLDTIAGFTTLEAQLAHFGALPLFDQYATVAYHLLREHAERVTPGRRLMFAPHPDGVLRTAPDDQPAIFFAQHEPEPIPWALPRVQADDAGADQTAASYLSWLADEYTPGSRELPAGFADQPAPLLFQLARVAIDGADDDDGEGLPQRRVAAATRPGDLALEPGAGDRIPDLHGPGRIPGSELAAVRAALRRLAGRSVDELDQLLRETVGLVSHRLDAWNTAFAADRLDELRQRRGRGLQVGGFGVVFDLRPRRGPANQGYVHASSLAHATSAAVLRAGWLAHGGDDAASPFAVDLGSGRVRTAAWLLEGVARGSSPATLLGRRFERALHDAGLDAWIQDVRDAVRAAADAGWDGATADELGPAHAAVDGLLLARLADTEGPGYAAGYLADTVAAVRAARTADDGALIDALADVAAAADAVADAAIAESVHRAAAGDLAGAATTLDAVSTGELPPPELEIARTRRTARIVSHRLLVLLDERPPAHPWPDARGHAWSAACPALETWAAQLLGDPATIGATLRWAHADDGDDDTPRSTPLTVATLGLSALELVLAAPAAEGGDAPLLTGLARAALARAEGLADERIVRATLDLDDPGGVDHALGDVSLLARALRALLIRASAASGLDLAATGDEQAAAGVDGGALRRGARRAARSLRAAVDALTEALDGRVDGATSDRRLRRTMAGLAGFGVAGCLPARPTAGAALDALALAVLGEGERRVGALDALAEEPAGDTHAQAAAGLAAVLGTAVVAPPSFTPPDPSALAANLARSADREREPLACAGWMAQVARVRPAAARLERVLDLADLLADGTNSALSVAQLPDLDGDDGRPEPWIATHPPGGESGDRTGVVICGRPGLRVTGDDGAAAPLAGLRIDAWAEALPGERQTTAVAFHHDAPAAEAPQSVLLVVPRDDDDGYDLDRVVAAVRDTLQWARLRAVGPDELTELGHYAPAVFSSRELVAGSEEAP